MYTALNVMEFNNQVPAAVSPGLVTVLISEPCCCEMKVLILIVYTGVIRECSALNTVSREDLAEASENSRRLANDLAQILNTIRADLGESGETGDDAANDDDKVENILLQFQINKLEQELSKLEQQQQTSEAEKNITEEESEVKNITEEESHMKNITEEEKEVKNITEDESDMMNVTEEEREVKNVTEESIVKNITEEESDMKNVTEEATEVKKNVKQQLKRKPKKLKLNSNRLKYRKMLEHFYYGDHFDFHVSSHLK